MIFMNEPIDPDTLGFGDGEEGVDEDDSESDE